jgi:hypothetical protein
VERAIEYVAGEQRKKLAWTIIFLRMCSPLLMTSLAEGGSEPLKTLIQTITGRSAGGLNVPSTLAQAVETELVCDFGSVHGVGQILLVGENQENGVAQLILVEHALELLTGLNNTVTIVGVDDEDDTLGVLEVVPPQGTDLVLTTDIPHGELDVLILDGLDVEALVVLVVGGSYYRRQGLVFSLSERRVR